MKRSEMIKFIESELIEIINQYSRKSKNDDEFYNRKAAGMLDMIEGFDMKPPCSADFGGHGTIINGSCDDYIESCTFKWEED